MINNNTQQKFTENLKRLLKEQNKTQKDLSNYIGVSPSTINFYTRGANMPRYGKLKEIAEFFNVSVNELLGVVYYNDIIEALEQIIYGVNINVIKYDGEPLSDNIKKHINNYLGNFIEHLTRIIETEKQEQQNKKLEKIKNDFNLNELNKDELFELKKRLSELEDIINN